MTLTAQEKADHAKATAGIPAEITDLVAEVWYRFEEYCKPADERVRSRHVLELRDKVSDLISYHPDFDVITNEFGASENTDELRGPYDAMEAVFRSFQDFAEATTVLRRAKELDRLSNAVGDLISWHKDFNYRTGRIDGVYEDE